MNSDLIEMETLQHQLLSMVLASFFQLLEFVQQVVGLFSLTTIVQRPVAQYVRSPDSFKGSLSTIEQIEAELGGERG